MTRLCNLICQWWGEFPHIWNILTGKYPARGEHSLSYLERLVMSLLVFLRFFSLSHVKHLALENEKERRTQLAEIYVVSWFVLLVVVLFQQPHWMIAPWLIAYRIIDGFNYQLCVLFVDRYRIGWQPRSSNRSIILLLVYYFELIVGFAGLFLYTQSVTSCQHVIDSSWDALYFSILTITTLGDEGFKVNSAQGRFLVSVEAILSILFLVLVVSTFVNIGITKRSSRRAKTARG